jgi:hypothetical protein
MNKIEQVLTAVSDFVMMGIARFVVWGGSDEYREKMKNLGA